MDEPIAAAIGAGVDITKPFGNLIVDIGAGTTDVAVVSVGGVVVSASVKVAGDNFDHAIMNYVREKHSLFIGEVQRRISRSRSEQPVKKRIFALWRSRAEISSQDFRRWQH